MKIAIIGTGISGLVAAHHLHPEHDITLYEANDYVGGHTNTVDVQHAGEHQSIDTGFIVFNDRTYPNFVRLLNQLNVKSRSTTMSFSVRSEDSGLEYNGNSLDSLFAQRRNLVRPSFYRLLTDILRFNRYAPRLVADCSDETTVADFVARHEYSKQFIDHYLLPMGAAIWSCPSGAFAQFPIRFIVEFYRNHGLLSLGNRPTWRVVEGGSRSYVRAMTLRFADRIHLRTPVHAIQRDDSAVRVITDHNSANFYDHVVFACHSDQALKILAADVTANEREILSAFPYSRNVAVLHTDIATLPTARKAWASWNYRIKIGQSPFSPATVTYNMNMLQGIESPHTYLVTLNDTSQIRPDRILRQFEYHHPVFTARRRAAQARHPELLFSNRTSFCGAYWGNGFHEDGVNSALSVVNAIQSRTRSAIHLRVTGNNAVPSALGEVR